MRVASLDISNGLDSSANHKIDVPLPERPLFSSFIRRCWYSDRGCYESSVCSDIHALFKHRKKIDRLPVGAKCQSPTYVVTGTRHRQGFMISNRLDSLEFPGEEWHKCCFEKSLDKKQPPTMLCEKLDTMSHDRMLHAHHGFCGAHACVGYRDRCLLVNKQTNPEFKSKLPGICPKACPHQCKRETYRMECIRIGEEPAAGKEGSEKIKVTKNKAEPYRVFSLCCPPPSMEVHVRRRDCSIPRRRKQAYGRFLS